MEKAKAFAKAESSASTSTPEGFEVEKDGRVGVRTIGVRAARAVPKRIVLAIARRTRPPGRRPRSIFRGGERGRESRGGRVGEA